MVQLSHPYMTTGKMIGLTIWTFVGKLMSLLFNMLSRFVIVFLPRSKGVLISWLQSPPAAILETKIMVSSPITSWQIDGEEVETVTDFLFLGSIITVDGDCSHNIRRHLLLGRKTMTNLDSILKSRDITLLTKVHMVQAMIFPVVMYGCESWTIKKAEHQRTDAFKSWC